MAEVTTVRHLVLAKGESQRAVAKQLGLSRNTVKRYVNGAPAGVRRASPRRRPKLEAVKARLDELLGDSPRWTGGKQQLTAMQLWRMLRAEGFSVGASLVKSYMHEWRRRRAEVFVPLVYRPGDLGEVDFFEVLVEVAGKRIKAWMFLMRGMASGKDFAWLFPRQDATCFLEGHVRGFEHLGAVFHRLVYDNLRAAVAKMLLGSERELAPRFAALTNHYLYEPCFARPGTGHDKGGVEARGKGVRWAHLVPIPAGDSLEAISSMLLARLDAEAKVKCDAEGHTVEQRFAAEKPLMLPLPGAPFEPAEVKVVPVTRRALVTASGATYSVWSRWAGLTITAYVGVDRVVLAGPDDRVEHPRKGFGGRSVDYRHYLPELSRKPQALRQVMHELLPKLDERYARAWLHLVDQHGPKQAARVFAQVLKAVEADGEQTVANRIELAIAANEPLQLAVRGPQLPAAGLELDALPAALRNISVPSASAADFDTLLGGAR